MKPVFLGSSQGCLAAPSPWSCCYASILSFWEQLHSWSSLTQSTSLPILRWEPQHIIFSYTCRLIFVSIPCSSALSRLHPAHCAPGLLSDPLYSDSLLELISLSRMRMCLCQSPESALKLLFLSYMIKSNLVTQCLSFLGESPWLPFWAHLWMFTLSSTPQWWWSALLCTLRSAPHLPPCLCSKCVHCLKGPV